MTPAVEHDDSEAAGLAGSGAAAGRSSGCAIAERVGIGAPRSRADGARMWSAGWAPAPAEETAARRGAGEPAPHRTRGGEIADAHGRLLSEGAARSEVQGKPNRYMFLYLFVLYFLNCRFCYRYRFVSSLNMGFLGGPMRGLSSSAPTGTGSFSTEIFLV